MPIIAGIGEVDSAEPSHAMWALSRLDPDSQEFADQFAALILATRERLKTLYASGLPAAEMRAAKQAEFERLRADYRVLRDTRWQGYAGYDEFVNGEINNAKLVPLNLNDLINDVLALYGHAIEQGILRTELGENLPNIMGDATLLRQVVHNLVQNALDSIGEHPPVSGSAQVLIRTDGPLNDDGSIRAVRLVIRDNGPGFPDKILKRAFEPYITTKAKGTGLGLAVVKKIADEHGARLDGVGVIQPVDADRRVGGPGANLGVEGDDGLDVSAVTGDVTLTTNGVVLVGSQDDHLYAVDAAGVHPLLLAIGSERYTPFDERRRPQDRRHGLTPFAPSNKETPT